VTVLKGRSDYAREARIELLYHILSSRYKPASVVQTAAITPPVKHGWNNVDDD
jgi:hypothetical protein